MTRSPIMMNERFGTFTVIDKEIVTKNGLNKTFYIIKCDCGEVLKRIGSRLRSCYSCSKCNINRLIGSKHHKATFLEYIGRGVFKIQCDCGIQYAGRARSKSCGCHLIEAKVIKARGLNGFKFGMVRVVSFLRFSPRRTKSGNAGEAVYKAKCKCGVVFEIGERRIGNKYSCGCTRAPTPAKGQKQGSSKLSDTQVKACIDLYLTGIYSKDQVCSMTQVPLDTLNAVICNKSWKHIQPDSEVFENSPFKETFRNRKRMVVLPGQQFNDWIVLEKAESHLGHRYWLCKCKCGYVTKVDTSALNSGKRKKCKNCNLECLIQKRREHAKRQKECVK